MLSFHRSLIARVMVSLIVAFTIVGVSGCSTTEALVSARYTEPVPDQFAATVIDAKTGKTLYSVAADEPRYPASLTKMMTLYLLFVAIDSGQINGSTEIPVSRNAASEPASKLYLKAGSTIPVDTAIRALVVKSANDVATAVAEFLADGSEQRFAAIMTQQAHALGMTSTRFKNATGLHDPEQVTTASDMARLSLALKSRFPHHYHYFSLRSFDYNGKTIRGHNKAMDMIAGADGIKTGYTRASGFNLTTSVRKNGKSLVGVVMGEKSPRVRDQRMTQLMGYYLRR